MVVQDATHRFVSDMDISAWDGAYEQSAKYTDNAVAKLIGSAQSTLDTLEEIAAAMGENEDVVEALDAAIGKKADQKEMESMLGAKLGKTGDIKDNTISFTSEDGATPAEWMDVPVMESGERHSSFFGKISAMFKNVRYLYKMLGTTDIALLGDGTLTGAISELNPCLVYDGTY